MVIQKQNQHNGVRHEIVETAKSYDATFGTGKSKSVMVGRVCVERMSGSYKYGTQIQIVVYGNVTEERTRNNDRFDRIEICMPLEDGIELLKEAVKRMESSS